MKMVMRRCDSYGNTVMSEPMPWIPMGNDIALAKGIGSRRHANIFTSTEHDG
jgi:hypothetical protein